MFNNRAYVEAIKNRTKLPFPYMVQLEITNSCPFNCPQCYKEPAGTCHMDFDKLKQFIVHCYDNGTRIFVLNGGEPMLYYKINELLFFLNTLDVQVNCFTSGYNITDDIIKLWNFDKNKFCLSLNGSTEKINGLTRQGYDVTIKAMNKLTSLKKRYGINWVARHDNLMDFKSLLNLCERYSVGFVFVTSEKLTGTGKLMSPLNKEDYIYLSNVINNYTGNIKIVVEACFPTLDILTNKDDKYNYFMGCFAGMYGCHVDMNFDFSPCTHLVYHEKFESINDYWCNSSILQQIREHTTQNYCSSCVHHYRCDPCSAWNNEMYHDFAQGYSSCPLFKSNL